MVRKDKWNDELGCVFGYFGSGFEKGNGNGKIHEHLFLFSFLFFLFFSLSVPEKGVLSAQHRQDLNIRNFVTASKS